MLVASYFFYMSWDYRFGGLILFSTALDFWLGLRIAKTENIRTRNFYLTFSLIANLVFILGFFKYYNFLANSLADLLGLFGVGRILPALQIILPVGVSFYTFQSLSYTIDVYRKMIPPERSLIRFALFVSFFPQLVAGPIVTAKWFLPQLNGIKKFGDIPFRKATRYFLMGYFKKVVLSDNISPIADLIFSHPEGYGTAASWLAAFLFWVQVYCDFSGYTDMAYGVGLMFGYELPENFRLPYISRSITEHWRRWHITLSVWIRDYIYISLGGNRGGEIRHRFNIWFAMFLGGIWHGANWTFVVWGALQGLLLMVESILKSMRLKYIKFDYSFFKPILGIFGLLLTSFFTITLGIIFRSDNISKAWIMLTNMFNYTPGGLRVYMLKTGIPAILTVILGHLIGYYIFEQNKKINIHPVLEFSLYPVLIVLFAFLTPDAEIPFIYFQF